MGSQRHQERAYIAASRRKDRNIEGRVRSAYQASKVHEKRTGKELHITQEIVASEKEYEEEERNDLDSHRHLYDVHVAGCRLASGGITKKWASNRLLSDAEWRGNLVNKLFSSYFPNFGFLEQQVTELPPNFETRKTHGSTDAPREVLEVSDGRQRNKNSQRSTYLPSYFPENVQNCGESPPDTDSALEASITPSKPSPLTGTLPDATLRTYYEAEASFTTDLYLNTSMFIDELRDDHVTVEAGMQPTLIFASAPCLPPPANSR
jgi:hypothetical protein